MKENATADFPNLTKSGSIDVRENATLNTGLTKGLDYISVDGSMFVVESKKTSKGIKIYSGYNVVSISNGTLNKSKCYVASKKGFTAHGETVKKAINDLQFKIVSEKLKNEPIKADTIININHYRLLTGACEFGVKSWMEQNNMTKKSYRADELLPILEKTNAYGLIKFKSLISFDYIDKKS